MPTQYVCCGRPVPRLGTRRISFLLVSLALFAVLSLLFTLPGAVPTGPSLKAAGRSFSIPKSLKSPWMSRIHLYPFKQPAHPPARQRNDTDGDSWWYADWKWLLMPFSSSVTLDENRALLPMLKERTPIYCYYDNTAEKDRPSRDAESDLLLAWRRAWWAQGFRPIILSPAEAMNNPLYEELQRLQDVTPELRVDLMRWLAWENMGDGLLAHRLLFPMGLHGDPLLTFLRRGEFPELTRFKGLDGGLFVGPKSEVTAAVKIAMAGPQVKEVKDLVAAVQADKRKQKDPFAVDDTPKSLAYYSERQIVARYAKVAEAIRSSRASGIKSLTQLINAHLHLTWQSIFSDGIAVVKPLRHTTTLIAPGYELASRLAHCSESPLPDTCPPNRPRCTPCDDSKPMKITTPQHYSNASTLYTIGAVPHPYTSSTLDALKSHVDIGWIRRASPRDAWITALTEALFSPSVSTGPRLLRFKQAVASDDDDQGGGGGGAARSLWLPAEQAAAALPDDLDWHFGFALPDRATYASSSSSATAAATNDDADTADHSPTKTEEGEKEEEALEAELFTRAQTIVLGASAKTTTSSSFPHHNKNTKTTKPKPKSKPTARDLALRDALEAWNLADTEAWRFARAHLARGSVERRRWEEDEARYAGGMGSEKKKKSRKNNNKNQSGGAKRAWDRWLDRD